MSRLPCLRYKISDSVLSRTGFDYITFFQSHPMTGPRYGDFHLEKEWVDNRTYTLSLTQDFGAIYYLDVRQFKAPTESDALDLKGRSIYKIPFAIHDVDETTSTVRSYLDKSVELYLDSILDDTDSLIFNVFHAALRLSVFPEPVRTRSPCHSPHINPHLKFRIRFYGIPSGCGLLVAFSRVAGDVVEVTISGLNG